MKQISDKQKKRLEEWHTTCMVKRAMQIEERGYIYCEECNLPERETVFQKVWGHHRNFNRADNSLENCELTHWICNQKIHNGG